MSILHPYNLERVNFAQYPVETRKMDWDERMNFAHFICKKLNLLEIKHKRDMYFRLVGLLFNDHDKLDMAMLASEHHHKELVSELRNLIEVARKHGKDIFAAGQLDPVWESKRNDIRHIAHVRHEERKEHRVLRTAIKENARWVRVWSIILAENKFDISDGKSPADL